MEAFLTTCTFNGACAMKPVGMLSIQLTIDRLLPITPCLANTAGSSGAGQIGSLSLFHDDELVSLTESFLHIHGDILDQITR